MYKPYRFDTVIITMGAMGAVPKSLEGNLKKLNLQQERLRTVMKRMQKAALIGETSRQNKTTCYHEHQEES